MDYKFLSDGRKVAVIGKLNNTEFIVREVFISEGGDEIPSGESFTTKSLHDKPVESWLKREEKAQKERVDKAKSETERINKEIEGLTNKLNAKKAMLANSPELAALVGESASLLAAFMTGTVEYLVVEDYGLSKPVKMEEFITTFETNWGNRRFDGLRLASVLGRSAGKLDFRINHYGDCSGSGYTVHPFETLEDAVRKIKELAIERINNGRFTKEYLTLCDELGIKFDQEHKDKFLETFSKSVSSGIEACEKAISDNTKRVSELKADIILMKEKLGNAA